MEEGDLQSLQPRQKWVATRRNLQVDDVVVIMETKKMLEGHAWRKHSLTMMALSEKSASKLLTGN